MAQSLPSKVVVDYDDVDFFQSYAAPDFKVEYLVISSIRSDPTW